MVLPDGRVFSEYRPVRCSPTPQAEMAPVQDVSAVGLAFCASGSGCEVEMIQSALPAVSASVLSNNTLYGVAACAAGALLTSDAVVKAAAPVTTATAAPPIRRESRGIRRDVSAGLIRITKPPNGPSARFIDLGAL